MSFDIPTIQVLRGPHGRRNEIMETVQQESPCCCRNNWTEKEYLSDRLLGPLLGPFHTSQLVPLITEGIDCRKLVLNRNRLGPWDTSGQSALPAVATSSNIRKPCPFPQL
ncbi:hypothetical protein TNCV_3835201 [Trichonephila clavipes]|nr:hypothetical protein TNCV_3835201 [Trichonephila clavipes]